jgi:hypothetical protein
VKVHGSVESSQDLCTDHGAPSPSARKPFARFSGGVGWGAIVLAVALGVDAASTILDPWAVTRIRNFLVADVGSVGDFAWAGDAFPPGFRQERGPVDKEFIKIAETYAAQTADSVHGGRAWATSLRLAEHLVSGPGRGEAVQSTTSQTYKAIVFDGKGYCADYTQVFNGLAHASHIPVREWGMSFDSFGGNGHAFNEIWDERLKQWVFIDVFNSFYVVSRQTRKPLSVMEFHTALKTEVPSSTIEVKMIDPARFGFAKVNNALKYYRDGIDQFYLWLGNDVFAYDKYPLVKELGQMSRALEQIWTIVNGVHPTFVVPPTQASRTHYEAMQDTATRFFAGAAASFLFGIFGFSLLLRNFVLRRRMKTS